MDARTESGARLGDLAQGRVLLVFLRHAGCTFCREALADIASQRAAVEQGGARIVLVHLGTPAQGRRMTQRFGLDDLERISDPGAVLYRGFALQRGSFRQLFGLRVWRRAIQAFLSGHGIGGPAGDGLRMPGVFLLEGGRIVREFRHLTAADRPDYCRLAGDHLAV